MGGMLDGAEYEMLRNHKRYTRADPAPVRSITNCTSPEFIAIKRER
jgi:hypothetical protein